MLLLYCCLLLRVGLATQEDYEDYVYDEEVDVSKITKIGSRLVNAR